MRVNINQIAELAQVSKGTVSKALNGQKGVGEETRRRILSLVEALDYQPDSTGRALALKRTGNIGLLIPHAGLRSLLGQYWPMVLAGVSQRASELQLNLMVQTLSEEGDPAAAVRQILRTKLVDGLIIGGDILDTAFFAQLVEANMPFVLLGQNSEVKHYCVEVDSIVGTDLMIRHILAQGYRRIGAIFGPLELPYSRDRRDGYRAALGREGITWTAEASCDYVATDVTATLNRLLDAHPDMDALYVASGGEFFLDCLSVLAARGVSVPRFGVGTFDDYPFLNFLEPKVTAVRQPGEAAGGRAVDLLTELIDGRPPEETLFRLEPKLVVRQSLGEAPYSLPLTRE